MRLLHTSDLHLGRSLGPHSLIGAQQRFLDQIVDAAVVHGVRAVVVAGDVYDRAVPPAESVTMFDAFLRRLRECDVAVVVISGNHDHPLRLGYGAHLFREGLHVLTDPQRIHEPVVLADDEGEVLVYGIPYLDPEVARRELAPAPGNLLPASHEAVVGEAMRRVRADLAARGGSPRVVVVSHAFVLGGEATESERDVRVGGVPSVPSAVYDGAHYVALGHLHRRQAPAPTGTSAVLHYSGSPLRYSISEAGHDKTITLVDIGARGEVTLTHVEVPQPRPMAELRGTIDELTGPAHARHRESWVRVIITDRQRPEDTARRLRECFPFHVDVRFEPEGVAGTRQGVLVTAASDPIEVVEEFSRAERGEGLSEAERQLIHSVLAELRAAERAG